MPKTLALDEFCRYIEQQRQAIEGIRAEIEEVRLQFDAGRKSNLQEWQTTLAKGVPLLADPTAFPSPVAQSLLKAIAKERAGLEKEIAELTAKVAELRKTADSAVGDAQAQVAALRRENPQLNAQEEELKARCAALRQTIHNLDTQIRNTGFLTGFFRRRRLRKARDEQRRALADQSARLRAVRQTWEDTKKRFQDHQSRLHEQWEKASLEAAQIQARIDYLQDNLERLSRQNGAAAYLAELAHVPEASEPLRGVLAKIVELNRIRQEYEEGLRVVSEALGLLRGLGESVQRFGQSAQKVLDEQRVYSLPRLRVRLSDEVLAFHAVWPEFRAQVKDERQLGAQPTEFSRRVQAIIRERLGKREIAATFESMGEALNQATKAWH